MKTKRERASYGTTRKATGWVAACGVGLGLLACGDDETGTGGGGSTTTTSTVTTGASTTTASTTASSSTSTTGSGGGGGEQACTETAPAETRGGPIAISPDDSTLVVANRDAGSVSVLRIDYGDGLPAMTKVAEIQVGSEPWQVALDGCGRTAYVVSRAEAKLIEISGIDTDSPVKTREVAVGSEPTGVALSPNNRSAFVANWVEGTVSVVDTGTMTVSQTLDLNATLASSGFLGTVAARPALAHPRSVAVTNDGDDDDTDETVLVTEFFGQRDSPEASPNAANADINWVGLLYRFGVGASSAELVGLDPVEDTGFPDGNGAATGCFPNQVQSITIRGSLAFVSSICASPRGPLGVKNMTHPVIHAVDFSGDESQPATLTKAFADYYVDQGYADDASRRYPLVTDDIAFDPTTGDALVSANGADAVFRLDFDDAGALVDVAAGPTNPFVDLGDAALGDTEVGRGPIGLVIAQAQPFAFVANDITRNVTAVALNGGSPVIAGLGDADARVAATSDAPSSPEDQAYLRGKYAFNTGVANWSLNGQAWGACQSCHFEGLSDNVTWYFGRGPRQSTSLDGSFASTDPTDQRIFNWTAVFDEIADFEAVARSLDGAKAALVHPDDTPINLGDPIAFPPAGAAGLNGSSTEVLETVSDDKTWADVEVFIQRVRSPRAPVTLAAADVAAGKALFEGEGQCQGCHGGEKWTISTRFYTPSGATNEALKTTAWDGAALVTAGFPAALLPATAGSQVMRFAGAGGDQLQCALRPVGTYGTSPAAVNVLELTAAMNPASPGQGNGDNGKGFNIPSILGMSVGAPYYHAGNARTLEEALDGIFAEHHRALAGPTFLASDSDKKALVAFLLSIDESTSAITAPASPGSSGGWFCDAP